MSIVPSSAVCFPNASVRPVPVVEMVQAFEQRGQRESRGRGSSVRVLPLGPSRPQQQSRQSFVGPGGGGELVQAVPCPRGHAGPEDWN